MPLSTRSYLLRNADEAIRDGSAVPQAAGIFGAAESEYGAAEIFTSENQAIRSATFSSETEVDAVIGAIKIDTSELQRKLLCDGGISSSEMLRL
jgi:hypothetical protein